MGDLGNAAAEAVPAEADPLDLLPLDQVSDLGAVLREVALHKRKDAALGSDCRRAVKPGSAGQGSEVRVHDDVHRVGRSPRPAPNEDHRLLSARSQNGQNQRRGGGGE